MIQALITFALSFLIAVPITGFTFLFAFPAMILVVIGSGVYWFSCREVYGKV